MQLSLQCECEQEDSGEQEKGVQRQLAQLVIEEATNDRLSSSGPPNSQY